MVSSQTLRQVLALLELCFRFYDFVIRCFLKFSASHPELRIPGSDIFLVDVGNTRWELSPHSDDFCLLHHYADNDDLQHCLEQEQERLHLQVLDR